MARRLTTEEFIQRAQEVHQNKYDYSQTVYVDSRSDVIVICPKHGAFVQKAVSHLSGNGCPKCAREWTAEHRKNLQESSRKSRGMTTEQWIERARAVHGDKYDYSQICYVNQRTDVTIICPVHGAFIQKADSHIRGSGCRKCADVARIGVPGIKWNDERRTKIEQTCIERYGSARYLDSKEGKAKVAKIKSNPDFREKMREVISSDEVQEKTRATCVEKYGVVSAMKLQSTIDKVGETKRLNGTWSTSKPEERMYAILCDVFGQDDINRHYKEFRYPWHCDFYVKSLDLFIELNATWLHGGYWFDSSNPDDLAKLQMWESKVRDGKVFYNAAIDVWCVRDVVKHDMALQNKLNYLVFWKNDLSDFIAWLNTRPLLLNNVS